MANKICSDCGTEQDDSFKYCKNCGALLSNESEGDLFSEDIENQKEYDNSANVKICPECGTEQETFAKFCRNCGAPFSAGKNDESVRRCSNCGAELNEEAFCPDCGKATGIAVCPNCGQKTDNEDFCPFCGYKINPNVKKCWKCGNKIDARANVCARCGANVKRKSPIIALVLSFIFPGLGQFHIGLRHKALLLVICYIVSYILVLIAIGGFLIPLIWLYGMYDAFVSAKAINNGEVVEDTLFGF